MLWCNSDVRPITYEVFLPEAFNLRAVMALGERCPMEI